MAKPTEAAPYKDDEVRKATGIEPEAIQEEYVRVPDDLRHFRKLLSQAKADAERADLSQEQVEASLRTKFRTDSSGFKRGDPEYMTADDIDGAIEGDTRRLQVAHKAIEARQLRDELLGICEAIKAKQEMVVNLGADLREERAANRGRA